MTAFTLEFPSATGRLEEVMDLQELKARLTQGATCKPRRRVSRN